MGDDSTTGSPYRAVPPTESIHGSAARRGPGLDGAILRLETRVDDGETVIRLDGEGDMTTAPLLSRALTHAGPHRHQQLVVIDLSALAFLDASFLAVIARHRQCGDIHRIILRSPTPFVARILDMVGWNDLIDGRDAVTA
jgi:anti-anti-sigma factor